MVSRQAQNREQKAAGKKQKILQAGLAVFSRKGYGEATIPDIAAEAGVAVGTIYLHYPSKRELLLSIISEFIVTEPFLSLLRPGSISDDVSFYSSIIADRLEFGFENLDKFLFLLSEVQRDPELLQQYRQRILQPMMTLQEGYLHAGVAAGRLRALNPQVASRAIAAMLLGLALLYKLEGEASPLQSMPRAELVSELTALILGGLRISNNKTSEK